MRLSSCVLASSVMDEAPEAAAWQSGKNADITGVFWEPNSEVEVSLQKFIGECSWNLWKERKGKEAELGTGRR